MSLRPCCEPPPPHKSPGRARPRDVRRCSRAAPRDLRLQCKQPAAHGADPLLREQDGLAAGGGAGAVRAEPRARQDWRQTVAHCGE
eukprot:6202625-Prymnesium_polylepis.2